MTVKHTGKRKLPPTHPGEMLREDFMPDFNLSTASMAAALGVSRQTINEILRERRSVTPAMALRLSRLFGNSPEFWLNVQHARDLWDSEQRYKNELDQIQPLNAA
jgi:addiction module HigA family antidote